MRIKRTISAAIAAGFAVFAIVMLPATGATKSNSSLRSYHGKVTGISTGNKAFRVRLNNGAHKRFRVNGTTGFQRINGFAGLRKGLRVEVKAKKGSSIARKVEPEDGTSGGAHDRGGVTNHNSTDDPPGDDHGSGGHGTDDPTGDDHGSGGHGADDPPGDDHGSGGHGSDD